MKLNILFAFILTTALLSCKKENPDPVMLIKQENLKQTIEYLTSPELKGRLAGSEELQVASAHMAEKFNKLGLIPKGTKGYFQEFNIEHNKINRCSFSILSERARNSYKLGFDYACRGFSGSGKITAPVVFCGYGQENIEIGYSDYENIDVKGKIVMIFKFNPGWKINKQKWMVNSVRKKVDLAVSKGAKGVLFVSKPNDKFPQPIIGSMAHGKGPHHNSIPQMHIDISLANELLSENNTNLKALQTKIDQKKTSASFTLKTQAHMFVDAEYYPVKKTRNVIAMIEGSDPKQKDEYIVLSAHLDHVGYQGNEVFYPGANDNASGCGAVMEIARVFSESNFKPKRSILFVLFDAEEQWMNGSAHFVKNPTINLKNIVTLYNFDCIAFGDSIMIGGGKSVPGLWKLAQYLDNEHAGLMVKDTWYGGGADAEAFFRKGVPTLYFATTNSYKHLHMPTDTKETLNYNLYEEVVKLGTALTREMAIRQSRPAIIPKD